jgi:hypothetical protein
MLTKRLTWAIALAVFILGSALALRYAGNAGLLDEETGRRAMQVLIGLMLAGYANLMPKQLGRARNSAAAEASAQAALRVGGWSLTLAGLTFAGLWAFAPLAFADVASIVVVVAAMLVTAGYAIRAFTACSRTDAAAGR